MEQLPRSAPLSREEVAWIEVGHTAVSRAVARALFVFFLAAIAVVPIAEWALRPAAGGLAPAAWSRLFGSPSVSVAAYQQASPGAGVWDRMIAANRAGLEEIAAFESALEDESMLGRTLRPPAQRILSGWLGAGNERVYVGRERWLFYRPDVEYITGPGFLDPVVLERRVASASEWTTPPQPDPRKAIVEFDAQLKERGIALIIVPTPVKPAIHPEQLRARYEARTEPVHNPSYARFIEEMRRAGVRVFDPSELLAGRRPSGAQYLATDTHWRPEAMELVAASLASFVSASVPLPDVPPPALRVEDVQVTNLGDTTAMLDLPRLQSLYPPETVWTRRVVQADGTPWRATRGADVLLLGDSFTNMYSLESMGWGTSAGFAEQVSYALQRPIDRIAQNDAGAHATRAILQQSPERLAATRVVIWQFAARELAFGDWRVERPLTGQR